MAETQRTLVGPRQTQALEAVRALTGAGSFDPDVWHVMDQRDNRLIEEEIIHGAGSNKFVYDFDIQGTRVAGISVIGARHLAAHYGGLKHRLVASQQKIGSLFTFTSFPAENMPMQVTCSVVHELADEPDFYGVVVEVMDIKTGNAIQVECRENRLERRRDRTWFERPHYPKIAQSKAYRNAVLHLLPQDIQLRWREQMLKLGKSDTITTSVIDEKRANVLQFAAQKAITIDRRALESLTLEQIAGLGDAAREGSTPAFVNAVKALGLVGHDQPAAASGDQDAAQGTLVRPRQQQAAPQQDTAHPPQQEQQQPADNTAAPDPGQGQAPDTSSTASTSPPADPARDTEQKEIPLPAGRKRGVRFDE